MPVSDLLYLFSQSSFDHDCQLFHLFVLFLKLSTVLMVKSTNFEVRLLLKLYQVGSYLLVLLLQLIHLLT